ncbi:MAG: hypothetical protein MZU84_08100 [Sphingobacterium sp.]|nr:hypothetical protein [Sphingobacterium sp.]
MPITISATSTRPSRTRATSPATGTPCSTSGIWPAISRKRGCTGKRRTSVFRSSAMSRTAWSVRRDAGLLSFLHAEVRPGRRRGAESLSGERTQRGLFERDPGLQGRPGRSGRLSGPGVLTL